MNAATYKVAGCVAALACGSLAYVSALYDRSTPPSDVDVRIKVGRAPGSVEAADFNKDGILDLAIASESDNTVTILLGAGGGRFREATGSPFPAGHAPNDIAIGDFDKDGNLDLAFANHGEKYLTVLFGDRKSTRLNSSHIQKSRMPSSA